MLKKNKLDYKIKLEFAVISLEVVSFFMCVPGKFLGRSPTPKLCEVQMDLKVTFMSLSCHVKCEFLVQKVKRCLFFI